MISLMKNKKGQWCHAYRRALLHKERQKRIVLTAYLAENGYGDVTWLANFWGVTKPTAADYLKASQKIIIDSSLKDKIQRVRTKKNCSIPDAIRTIC